MHKAERRTSRFRYHIYNFIFLFSFANGNTGNNAVLTAIRAILFLTEEQANMPDKANTKAQAEHPAAETKQNRYKGDGRWFRPRIRAK